MITFRQDALGGVLQLQRIAERTVVIKTRYRCPVHGHQVGTGFGGVPLKQLNCKVNVSEDKLCWEPLIKIEEKQRQKRREYHVDVDDFESHRYDHDWE